MNILELMPVDLNDPKASFIIFVGNPLDAGGFACSRIPEQKTVIGFTALHKGLRILNQLLLGNLVSHQIL